MSPLYDVTISWKKKSYKMAMTDPIRLILVPLNFILQGLSDKKLGKLERTFISCENVPSRFFF